MYRRFVAVFLAVAISLSSTIMLCGTAYAQSRPVLMESGEGFTLHQNADGSKTILLENTGETPADPSQVENWIEQGANWTNEGAVAQATLQKTYEPNEALVTLQKDGTSISFAPIMAETTRFEALEESSKAQQLDEHTTASNVLRFKIAENVPPGQIEGRLRRSARRASAASAGGSPAIYEGMFNDSTSLELTALSGGVKEDIVVQEYTGNHTYTYQMSAEGMTLRQRGQRIEWIQDGEAIGEVEAPFMVDASGSRSEAIVVNLSDEGILTYTPDDEWMQNAAYPVVIDPTMKYYHSEGDVASYWQEDSFVSSAQPNTIFDGYDGGVLKVSGVETAYTRPKFPDGSQPAPSGVVISNPSDILVLNASIELHVKSGSGSGNFSVHRVLGDWRNTNLTYANSPGYTPKAYCVDTLPTSGSKALDLTELFSEWFNMMDQKFNGGLAIVSDNGASRVLYGGIIFMPEDKRPKYRMNYIESPDAPVITSITAHGGGVNSGTGYVKLKWNAVNGASRYYVGIFNGKEYEYFLQPLGATEFSTQGMKIWPTQAEINAGRYKLHHDSQGTELPMSPALTYRNVPGGSYGSNANYYFKIIPANKYGQCPEPSLARFQNQMKSITLPDTVQPKIPAEVKAVPETYSNADTRLVSWNGVQDITLLGTSNSLGAYNSAKGWGNIQYSIDNTTDWKNTGINTASGSYTFPVTSLADGTHFIYIRGVDSAGNTGAFKGATFLVDRTPPTAPDVVVTPSTWTNANKASITWNGISDLTENLPLARVEYRWNADIWNATGRTDQSYAGFELNISEMDGPQTLSVRGVDRAGNDGLPGTATVYVDHSAPTISSVDITPAFWTALEEIELERVHISNKM